MLRVYKNAVELPWHGQPMKGYCGTNHSWPLLENSHFTRIDDGYRLTKEERRERQRAKDARRWGKMSPEEKAETMAGYNANRRDKRAKLDEEELKAARAVVNDSYHALPHDKKKARISKNGGQKKERATKKRDAKNREASARLEELKISNPRLAQQKISDAALSVRDRNRLDNDRRKKGYYATVHKPVMSYEQYLEYKAAGTLDAVLAAAGVEGDK